MPGQAHPAVITGALQDAWRWQEIFLFHATGERLTNARRWEGSEVMMGSDPVLIELIKSAAAEFGLPWTLLASQAWAESSFRMNALSPADARGLMQIMPATWAEWAPGLDAGINTYSARQNLRVGAAYMKWLLSQTGGNIHKALIAYGWGIGNVLRGEQPPAQWVEYANKIIHGKDLLDAVLAMGAS